MCHALRAAALCSLLLLPLAAGSDGPYAAVQEVLTARATVVGEPLRWPEGPPRVHAVVITLRPGESTPRHRHGVPLVAYLLEGELTVDYGERGQRVYRAGEGFLEAMGVAHVGTNRGAGPTRILATFLGAEGRAETERAPAAP